MNRCPGVRAASAALRRRLMRSCSSWVGVGEEGEGQGEGEMSTGRRVSRAATRWARWARGVGRRLGDGRRGQALVGLEESG